MLKKLIRSFCQKKSLIQSQEQLTQKIKSDSELLKSAEDVEDLHNRLKQIDLPMETPLNEENQSLMMDNPLKQQGYLQTNQDYLKTEGDQVIRTGANSLAHHILQGNAIDLS